MLYEVLLLFYIIYVICFIYYIFTRMLYVSSFCYIFLLPYYLILNLCNDVFLSLYVQNFLCYMKNFII